MDLVPVIGWYVSGGSLLVTPPYALPHSHRHGPAVQVFLHEQAHIDQLVCLLVRLCLRQVCPRSVQGQRLKEPVTRGDPGGQETSSVD